ncbi:MAG: hypothetical protein ACI9MB_005173, partial [Verrucomicrobiales bacterium]
ADGGRVVIRLEGKANRYGVGARVSVETDGDPGLHVRCLSLSRGFMSSNEPLLHFGLGEQEKVNRLVIDWPGGGQQVLTDLAAGRRYSIREVSSKSESAKRRDVMFVRSTRLSGVVPREQVFDDFERQPLLPYKHSQLGPGIAIGDVDADGLEDIYVSSPAGDSGRVYQRVADKNAEVGKSVFTVKTFAPYERERASEDMSPLFFDFDDDGDLDLFVVSGGVEGAAGDAIFRDRLYLNDGKGRFASAAAGKLPDLTDSGSVACAADFDQDGDLDLFVGGRVVPGGYPQSPRSRLLRNEAGKKFTEISGELFSGMVTSALWTDADGDGWLDLMVATEWGPVRLYHNTEGKLVERTLEAGLAGRSGWWNSIAGGDFDRDGDIDYVLGNVGLNTKYKAPAVLIYGDVDGTGKRRIVEAAFEGEKCYPIRGLSCSSHAMPFLTGKTPKFHDFASATLSELYRDLEKAQRFEANTLASGVLLNNGKGTFEFRELPAMAQVAPVFGIAVSDFDADGNLDLFLAQNFHSPQAETGRMDGGVSVLMRGLGDGNFSAMRADRSGLVIAGDAKGVALTDLNGDAWPDLLVAVNGGELQAFENVPPAGSRPLVVELRGGQRRTGTPARLVPSGAIGARISVKLDSGRPLVKEVYAGGGYLSQNSQLTSFAIPAGDNVESVSVRWADGKKSQRAIEKSDGARVVVER